MARQKYWRDRGTYGAILYRKIKRVERLFTLEYEKGITEDDKYDSSLIDHEKLARLSDVIDKSIGVQLKNIDKLEETEMMEIMEADNDNKAAIQKVEEAAISQRKF